MDHLQKKTSITIDEAIAILMGYATGPIDLEPDPKSDCEEAWDNIPDFDLGNLAEERGVLEGEYDLAKHEKRSAHVVAEKLAALNRQKEIIDQVYDHRCAIEDELNKGERSMLRVDVALSNPAFTYITRHSFKEWVKCKQSPAGGLPDAAEAANPAEVSVSSTKEKKRRDKGIRQQEAILAEIERRGYVATALPPHLYNEAGVKSAVREAIGTKPLFPSPKAFDRTWQTLRDLKLIGENAGLSSPQKVDGGDL